MRDDARGVVAAIAVIGVLWALLSAVWWPETVGIGNQPRGTQPSEDAPGGFRPSNVDDIPQFPWPPPMASSTQEIPWGLLAGNVPEPTFGTVATRLSSALDRAGYVEKSFYSVPGGFALATRLEQINSDGTPKAGNERWLRQPGDWRIRSITEYIKALFTARAGYYRVIVIVVSVRNLRQVPTKPTENEALGWSKSGAQKFPSNIPFDSECSGTALIYEFEKADYDKDAKLVVPGRLEGKIHLQKARIWSGLSS